MRLFQLLLGLGAQVVSSSPAASSSDTTTTTTSSSGLDDCTRTLTIRKFPTFTNDPTLTVWHGSWATVTETATVTSLADCHDCAHATAVTHSQGGHGPVVHHTTTVTSEAPPDATTTTTTTLVVYACSVSPAAAAEANGPLLASTRSPYKDALTMGTL